MPDSCCAFGCANRRKRGEKSLSFYRIPFGSNEELQELRKRGVAAIKRENWSDKQIENVRICSAHFVIGMFSLLKLICM